MLVMFGTGGTLCLAVVESDLQKLRGGLTLEYLNPPHDPQLVKNIVVMYGRDKQDVIRQVRAAGVNVTEATATAYCRGERTDRGFRPS